MNTQLTNQGNTKHADKIKITRLKEINIVNNGLLNTSERLAKAYNINNVRHHL